MTRFWTPWLEIDNFLSCRRQSSIIVRTDVLYHHTTFHLICMRTVGCETIWKLQEACPYSTSWEEIKIRLRKIVQTNVQWHPTKFQLNRMNTVGCESISKGVPPKRLFEVMDWCLVSSHQVSAQLDTICCLWIELKISRGAPPQRPLRVN